MSDSINEQRCPWHGIRDCSPLLNGCSWRPGPSVVTPPAQDERDRCPACGVPCRDDLGDGPSPWRHCREHGAFLPGVTTVAELVPAVPGNPEPTSDDGRCRGCGRYHQHEWDCPGDFDPTVIAPSVSTGHTDADKHNDSVADTGAAYSAFRGWLLTCLWCDFTARGHTKSAAMERLQEHYDGIGANVTVLGREAGRG